MVSVELSSSELFQQRVGSFILRHFSRHFSNRTFKLTLWLLDQQNLWVRCLAAETCLFKGNANNCLSGNIWKHLEPETEQIFVLPQVPRILQLHCLERYSAPISTTRLSWDAVTATATTPHTKAVTMYKFDKFDKGEEFTQRLGDGSRWLKMAHGVLTDTQCHRTCQAIQM